MVVCILLQCIENDMLEANMILPVEVANMCSYIRVDCESNRYKKGTLKCRVELNFHLVCRNIQMATGNPWDVYTLYDTNNDICGYSISFADDQEIQTTGFPPLETPLDPLTTNALTVFAAFMKLECSNEVGVFELSGADHDFAKNAKPYKIVHPQLTSNFPRM